MSETLTPAADFAAKRKPAFAGESADYAAARQRLLEEEIAFRRHATRLVEQRQALPPGPVIDKDYRFKDEQGFDVGLKDLFGDKDALVTYFWMYGPERSGHVRCAPTGSDRSTAMPPTSSSASRTRYSAAARSSGSSPSRRNAAGATPT